MSAASVSQSLPPSLIAELQKLGSELKAVIGRLEQFRIGWRHQPARKLL
jgi:hypothetical protein